MASPAQTLPFHPMKILTYFLMEKVLVQPLLALDSFSPWPNRDGHSSSEDGPEGQM